MFFGKYACGRAEQKACRMTKVYAFKIDKCIIETYVELFKYIGSIT